MLCKAYEFTMTERKLTETEKKVAAAAKNGAWLDLRSLDEKDREVRSSVLVELLSGENVHRKGVRLRGAIFKQEVDLGFLEVSFSLYFWECTFLSRVNFDNSKINDLNLTHSEFKDVFTADRMEAAGTFWADKAKFEAGLSIYGGHICGNFDLVGATVSAAEQAIQGTNLKVDGDLFTRSAQDGTPFTCLGRLLLQGATIGGDWDCCGGIFRGFGQESTAVINAQRIKVLGNILMRTPDYDAEVATPFQAHGKILLEGATVDGNWELAGGISEGVSASAITVSDAFITTAQTSLGSVNLSNAAFGALSFIPPSNPNDWKVHGMTYRELYDPESFAGDRMLAFLKESDEGKFFPQPYRQLFKVLRDLGHTKEATTVAIAMRNVEFERFLSGKDDNSPWWRLKVLLMWPFRFLHKHLISYGYSPARAMGWAFGIWAFATIVYSTIASHILDYMMPIVAAVDKQPHRVFSAPIFALDKFLPVVDLGQKNAWYPKVAQFGTLWYTDPGWWLIILNLFLTLSGWVIVTLLLAGATGLMKRINTDD